MIPSAVVFEAAKARGLIPRFHKDTQTVQIAGHRWDRWYALLGRRDPRDIYIDSPYGTQILAPGRATMDYDESHEDARNAGIRVMARH